jgi:catechol 2,3-dioxygenase-like lactoylglutathione lyase family enzyme
MSTPDPAAGAIPDRIPAALSFVTLGVADVGRSRAFYERIGFPLVFSEGDYAVFRTAGSFLALFPNGDFAADVGLAADTEPPRGFRGVSLAVNVASEAAVDAALATAVAAGGQVLRPADAAVWGGYTAYFTDPDGHAWELAYNPGWPLGDGGMPVVGRG